MTRTALMLPKQKNPAQGEETASSSSASSGLRIRSGDFLEGKEGLWPVCYF